LNQPFGVVLPTTSTLAGSTSPASEGNGGSAAAATIAKDGAHGGAAMDTVADGHLAHELGGGGVPAALRHSRHLLELVHNLSYVECSQGSQMSFLYECSEAGTRIATEILPNGSLRLQM
jgi:hypothetical protein